MPYGQRRPGKHQAWPAAQVPQPIADFSGVPLSGIAPLNVAFTDLTTNNPTQWAWDFENDGIVDSVLQNPSHVYTAAGVFPVKLTVDSAAGGVGSKTKLAYVTVASPAPPDVLIIDSFSEYAVAGQVAVPAHNPDDLIVAYAISGATEVPGLPAGWSSIGSAPMLDNLFVGFRMLSILDTVGDIASVTCSNAFAICGVIYRNALAVGAVGFPGDATGAVTSISLPPLTLASVRSVVLAGFQSDSGIGAPPADPPDHAPRWFLGPGAVYTASWVTSPAALAYPGATVPVVNGYYFPWSVEILPTP